MRIWFDLLNNQNSTIGSCRLGYGHTKDHVLCFKHQIIIIIIIVVIYDIGLDFITFFHIIFLFFYIKNWNLKDTSFWVIFLLFEFPFHQTKEFKGILEQFLEIVV